MEERDIDKLLKSIRDLPSLKPPNMPMPITQQNIVVPWLTWAPAVVEETLSLKLPSEIKYLWDNTSGLFLFIDITFGQSGLVVWSPDATIVRHKRLVKSRDIKDFRQGDLLIGEFLGDSDLLLLRCDPSESDFGCVIIVTPLDEREDWYCPATSISDFLKEYFDSGGEKFWEHIGGK
jgi:hypothetical protein